MQTPQVALVPIGTEGEPCEVAEVCEGIDAVELFDRLQALRALGMLADPELCEARYALH